MRLALSIIFSILLSPLVASEPASPPAGSVVFVGIARNCARNLPKALNFIDQARAGFAASRVFIYENDSNDATPLLLEAWSSRSEDVSIRSERAPEGGFPEFELLAAPVTRFDRIARARNVYMQELEKPAYDSFDFVIVVDLDLESYPAPQHLLRIFETLDWDCIAANGRHAKTGIYYDTFAFRNSDIPFGPEVAGPYWWSCLQPVQRLLSAPGTDRIPVASAFGGLAIYRKEAIRGERYRSVIPDEMLEHIRQQVLLDRTAQRLLSRCTYGLCVKPRMPLARGAEVARPGNICEHVPLHFRMVQKGFDRIFIDPQLVTLWQ